MTARLIRCLLGPALLLAALLSLLAPLIVEVLYGREYIPSIGPFILLLFAMIAKTATQFLSLYLVNQRERPNISSAINAASLLLGLLLLYLLVPPYGAVGAALALVITSVAQAGLYLWSFLRYTSLRLGEVLILRREDWAWLLSIGRLRRNAKVS
jgi:O-antigen/teichoic acid export membrane protein